MAFRTLTIDSAAELHVRSGQLTIQREQDPKPLSIDLDDLACIVLANLDITLSTGALNMISAHGITILGCGRNYMSTSIMLSFAQNSRYLQIVDTQLGLSLPFRKQLWKRIVRQKIANQAEVLRLAGRSGAGELLAIARSVRSGDPDNKEALAARFYFPRLKERWKQLAGTLSGGEQQMLATGRALMTDPSIVLMDEPSMGLSPLLVKEIFSIIETLHNNGITILLVEQNAKMALAVADRAYVLETGTISMSGKASDLANDDRVRKAYLGA